MEELIGFAVIGFSFLPEIPHIPKGKNVAASFSLI
jgi:hypothetical protein